jgi:hypothetical protein
MRIAEGFARGSSTIENGAPAEDNVRNPSITKNEKLRIEIHAQ